MAYPGFCALHGYSFHKDEGCPVCRKECAIHEDNARSIPKRDRSQAGNSGRDLQS